MNLEFNDAGKMMVDSRKVLLRGDDDRQFASELHFLL